VLEMILLLGRALAVACRGDHELVLENIALRQQLTAVKRSVARPHLRQRDRLFWIALAAIWTRWRSALMFVQPDTVVRWHREWFRWRWARRSRHGRVRRPPSIDAKTQALVRDMASANPLTAGAAAASTGARPSLRDVDPEQAKLAMDSRCAPQVSAGGDFLRSNRRAPPAPGDRANR
jgi:hypothetical protein